MKKICVFVPEEFLGIVKREMFAAGGGRIGNYDCCSFETQGKGQFRALKGAKPFVGELDKLQEVIEFKLEMVCHDEFLMAIISALKDAHPYETPAFEVYELLDMD